MSWEEMSAANCEKALTHIRRLSAEEKLRRTLGATGLIRALVEADIRRLHPDATPREIQARVAARLRGPELAYRLYGIVVDEN